MSLLYKTKPGKTTRVLAALGRYQNQATLERNDHKSISFLKPRDIPGLLVDYDSVFFVQHNLGQDSAPSHVRCGVPHINRVSHDIRIQSVRDSICRNALAAGLLLWMSRIVPEQSQFYAVRSASA